MPRADKHSPAPTGEPVWSASLRAFVSVCTTCRRTIKQGKDWRHLRAAEYVARGEG